MINTGLKYVLKQLLFVFIIFLLALLFFAVGLMVGYGIIGSGDNATSILSIDKWQALFDKFTG
ncbi:DNA-directed RNA polymerase subunit beta [Streptococcus fryi]